MTGTHPMETHHYLAVTVLNSRFVTIAARVTMNGRFIFDYRRSDDGDEPIVKVDGQDLLPATSVELADDATVTFGRAFQRRWSARDRRFEAL
ncbi:MAG TPA: hypothetical protein VNX21_03115 [Candidatus Thermoplasmatota archaeon]|nr:hypothetical protein [Candidatus Thermoplasmatota archaeon]